LDGIVSQYRDFSAALTINADNNSTTSELPQILHFSSQKKVYTKLEISQFFAKCLNIEDTSFLIPVTEGPKPGDTRRPRDCHLSNAALEKLGIDTSEGTSFETWFSKELAGTRA
jgi:S-adenosylmethionine synthetase